MPRPAAIDRTVLRVTTATTTMAAYWVEKLSSASAVAPNTPKLQTPVCQPRMTFTPMAAYRAAIDARISTPR